MQTQTLGVAIAMTALCMTCALLSLGHMDFLDIFLSMQSMFNYYVDRSMFAPLIVAPVLIFQVCRYGGRDEAIAKISPLRFGLLSSLLIMMGLAAPWFFHDFTRVFNHDSQCLFLIDEFRIFLSLLLTCSFFVAAVSFNRKLLRNAILKASTPFTSEESSLYIWTAAFYFATLFFQLIYLCTSSQGSSCGGLS